MFDIFEHQLSIYEKKARLAGAIKKLTKGKGRKYVMLSDLQSELDADDSEFEEVLSSARKANRYSNKYIFTDIDGKPAIGITALKRKGSKRDIESQDVSISGQGGDEVKVSDVSQTGADDKEAESEDVALTKRKVTESKAYQQREDELWEYLHRGGWKGLDRKDLLPEGWQDMSEKQIVNTILETEFLVVSEAGTFTDSQLETLKREYAKIKSIDPISPTYDKMTRLLDNLPKEALQQLVDAKVNWLGVLARNRLRK